jgi:dipeptidase D
VVIRVPATAGRESAPTVVLQGHLDMVCERDPASSNDPAEGRIFGDTGAAPASTTSTTP